MACKIFYLLFQYMRRITNTPTNVLLKYYLFLCLDTRPFTGVVTYTRWWRHSPQISCNMLNVNECESLQIEWEKMIMLTHIRYEKKVKWWWRFWYCNAKRALNTYKISLFCTLLFVSMLWLSSFRFVNHFQSSVQW